MANSSNSKPHIYVGCGGTGLKTLERFNELLCEDEYWRRRMGEDVYYIAVDTNEKDLRDFEAAIKDQCRGINPPWVAPISLGQGLQSIWPILRDYFVTPFEDGGHGTDAGKKRLEEHWWHMNGDPFRAEKVRDLRTGAGQCPPVSNFLAWSQLDGPLQHKFEELLEQMRYRRAHGGREPMEGVNFSLVAGLAGGTGRGCWELIALKLRDLFRREGEIVTPFAYLLDANCFRKVFRGKPAEELQMKVNSLTGISQLSGWLARSQGDGFQEYRLPSMRAPEDRDQDLIQLCEDHDTTMDRPAQKAYLICKGNRSVVLGGQDEYMDMLGAAIYTTLYSETAQSSIKAGEINQPQPVFGLGTATVEVESVRLRCFLEDHSRAEFLSHLSEEKDVDPQYASNLLSALGLKDSGGTKRRDRGLEAKAKGSGGTKRRDRGLAAKAVEYLYKKKGENILNQLLNQLAEQPDAADAGRIAQQLASQLSENDAKVAVAAIIDGMEEDPAYLVMKDVGQVLVRTGSLKGTAAHLEAIAAELEAESDRRRGSADPIKEFSDHIVELSKRPWFMVGVGDRFDVDELKALSSDFQKDHFGPIAKELVSEAITETLSELANQCRAWARSAKALAVEASRLHEQFEVKARTAANVAEGTDPIGEMFLDTEHPENAIEKENTSKRFFKRVLKPALPEGGLRSLVDHGGMTGTICDLLIGQIRNGISKDDRYARSRFRVELEECVNEEVNVGLATMKEHFSLEKVAKHHYDAWIERFEKERGDPDAFELLATQFRQFYGFRPDPPERPGDDLELFPVKGGFQSEALELLSRVAVDLAAHCWPYWSVSKEVDADRSLKLFFPAGSRNGRSKEDETRNEAVERLLKSHATNRVERWHPTVALGMNPFIAVAYSSEAVKGFDDVASFNYWGENPAVQEALEATEETDAKSVFDDTTSIGGRGFTSPMYVTDAGLAGRRWRPWYQGDGGTEVQRDRERALEALLYALTEPTDKFARKLQSPAWPMPLLEMDEQGKCTFQREELYYDEKDERPSQAVKACMTNPHWKKDEVLATGIARVFAALCGEEVPGGPKGSDGVHMRGRILEEKAEFWNDLMPKRQVRPESPLYRDVLEEMTKMFHDRAAQAEAAGAMEDYEVWRELREYAVEQQQR